jgi:ABC-type transporter lipoprotein component MlaA
MKRKEFLATGIVGLGGVITLTSAMVLKSEDKKFPQETSDNCALSPK